MKTLWQTIDRRRPLQVEMTPMIDVVFLLLIFFLWTASFRIAEQGLPGQVADTTLPPGTTDSAPEPVDFEPIVVRLLPASGSLTWTVNGQPHVSLPSVQASLRAAAQVSAAVPVIVDPAADVELGSVIDVYDAARGVGFEQVRLAAEVDAP